MDKTFYNLDISPIKSELEPLIKQLCSECIQIYSDVEICDTLYIIRYVTIYGPRTFYCDTDRPVFLSGGDRVYQVISNFIKSIKRDGKIMEVLNGN